MLARGHYGECSKPRTSVNEACKSRVNKRLHSWRARTPQTPVDIPTLHQPPKRETS